MGFLAAMSVSKSFLAKKQCTTQTLVAKKTNNPFVKKSNN
jgi:hypothetical protein